MLEDDGGENIFPARTHFHVPFVSNGHNGLGTDTSVRSEWHEPSRLGPSRQTFEISYADHYFLFARDPGDIPKNGQGYQAEEEYLRHARQGLSDCSHPQRRIVCR
jgi:hypothetical protein